MGTSAKRFGDLGAKDVLVAQAECAFWLGYRADWCPAEGNCQSAQSHTIQRSGSGSPPEDGAHQRLHCLLVQLAVVNPLVKHVVKAGLTRKGGECTAHEPMADHHDAASAMASASPSSPTVSAQNHTEHGLVRNIVSNWRTGRCGAPRTWSGPPSPWAHSHTGSWQRRRTPARPSRRAPAPTAGGCTKLRLTPLPRVMLAKDAFGHPGRFFVFAKGPRPTFLFSGRLRTITRILGASGSEASSSGAAPPGPGSGPASCAGDSTNASSMKPSRFKSCASKTGRRGGARFGHECTQLERAPQQQAVLSRLPNAIAAAILHMPE